MGVLYLCGIVMNIREMRHRLGDTQAEFALRYHIPFRSIQNWETGTRKPPEYILRLLEQQVEEDLINRKTIVLPKYDSKKLNLPKRSDFLGSMAWLKAIKETLGEEVVFALDEALMCQGNFLGREDEYIVWLYGSDTLARFNGVVILGNEINPLYVENKNGLRFTNFNRTLNDALANESILDMQGITEALSRIYFMNGESFNGILISPKYEERFSELMKEAKEYYAED